MGGGAGGGGGSLRAAADAVAPGVSTADLDAIASARISDDGWTVVSEDGGWSAHFEHTVAITAAGPWVLTASAGPPAGVLVAGQVIVRAAAPARQPHPAG